jgi:hypothetical protein
VRSRMLVIPSVRSLDDFAAIVGHVGHYLAHVEPESVKILVERGLVEAAEAWLEAAVLPAGYDDEVLQRVAAVAPKIAVTSWPCAVDPVSAVTDVVLVWDVARAALAPWVQVTNGYRKNRTLVEVDPRRRRHGASRMAGLAEVVGGGNAFDSRASRQITALVEARGGQATAYVVGTGQSARRALEHDMSDCVRIVCNTVVLDDELMDHIDPHVVTCADPVFDFGPSTYAHAFQRALVEQAKRHDFTIVTTERFAPLLRAHRPELAERVIGLRQGMASWPRNFDLASNPAVRPFPDTLTMLMMPVAATLARSAVLFGFDGRSPGEAYFGKHGSTVQFDRELDEIKAVHPGFFDIDHLDYYEQHVQDLHNMVSDLEGRGFRVTPGTPSNLRPLRIRSAPDLINAAAVARDRPMLVSVTPDWVDDFGHFGPFERRLLAASQRAGLTHVALTSTGLQRPEPWQLPTFTEPSFGLVPSRFGLELEQALDALEPPPGSVIGFYTSDVWQLPELLRIGAARPELRFVANLLRSHAWIVASASERDAASSAKLAVLRDALEASAGTNVKVAVDGEALQKELALLTGRELSIWPMIVVSEAAKLTLTAPRQSGSVRIVAPVHAQRARGFPHFVEFTERVAQRIASGEIEVVARFSRGYDSPSASLSELADRFVAAGGQIVEGNLTDDDYLELVAGADLVLVPYRLSVFRTRTSGVVLDALIAGKPVVTTEGSWGASVVEEYRGGAVYRDGDPAGLERAVDDILGRLVDATRQIHEVRERLAYDFSADRLVEFLLSGGQAPPNPVTAHAVVARSAASVASLLHMHEADAVRRSLIAVIREDNQRRELDAIRDETEVLRRELRWRDLRGSRGPSRPPINRTLAQAQLPRQAGAQLDELAMLARLYEARGAVPGRLADVDPGAASYRPLLEQGWTVEVLEAHEATAAEFAEEFADDDRVRIDGQNSTLADALAPGHVDVLRIGAGGRVLLVLKGYDWDADTPDVVVCAFEDQESVTNDSTTAELADFLSQKGFEVWLSGWHPILREEDRSAWRGFERYPAEVGGDAKGSLIAFRTPVDEELLTAVLWESLQVENEDLIPTMTQLHAAEFDGVETAPVQPNEATQPSAVLHRSTKPKMSFGQGARNGRFRRRGVALAQELAWRLSVPLAVATLAAVAAAVAAMVGATWVVVPALGVALLAALAVVLIVVLRMERKRISRRAASKSGRA